MPEQSFGQYEVLSRVAEGSTGTVYRARHVELGRVVAIKELNAEMLGVPGMRERLRSEAELLARLADPHVVEVYDYVEDDQHAWIAEEWVEGASLERILETHGTLTPEQAVGVVRDAVLGLAHAHDMDLVHRDISSRNILADMQGSSKLVDFGLAAPTGAEGAYGTPAFMSPEATTGGSLTKPSDVYSTAAVLYTVLAGRPPYAAEDVASTLRAHREAPVPELEGHGADLQALISRSMAKDPAQRPQDARAFLEELEEAAKRRFGATWLQRASIAGVVAGVVGTPAAVGMAAGAAVPSVAPTVVVDTASIATGAVTKAVKSGRGKAIGIAAAATVVVVGGVAAAVALTSGGSDDDKKPASTTQPKDEPTEPTLEEQSPSGQYRFVRKLVSSTYDPPGPKKESRTWTIDLSDCTTSSCDGKIKSSSGSKFQYAWNGRTLEITFKGANPDIFEGLCVDDVTGEEIAGTKGRASTYLTWAPMKVVKLDADGLPVRFEGSQRQHTTYEGLTGNCHDSPTDKARWTTVLTRLP